MNFAQYGGSFGGGYSGSATQGYNANNISGYGGGDINSEYGGNRNGAEGGYNTGGYGETDPNGAGNSYSGLSTMNSAMNSTQYGRSFGRVYGGSGSNDGYDRNQGDPEDETDTFGNGEADPNESGVDPYGVASAEAGAPSGSGASPRQSYFPHPEKSRPEIQSLVSYSSGLGMSGLSSMNGTGGASSMNGMDAEPDMDGTGGASAMDGASAATPTQNYWEDS